MALIPVPVPDLGDIADAAVIEILVKPGQRIEAEQSLITLESDKASMEVPSPRAGVVGEITVKLGDKVSLGQQILTLEVEESAATSAPPTATATPVATAAPVAAVPSAPAAPVAAPSTPSSSTPPAETDCD
ncbi:MAG TPA: biotin/lipoyl-containing protein, partial [Aquabacterium sp.]|nr:biotin/lipoyl-containing protein [Aquabacterium sp.]